MTESITVGGAVGYVGLGDTAIENSTTLIGDYDTNRILFSAINTNIKL